jgi:hypothetical protein
MRMRPRKPLPGVAAVALLFTAFLIACATEPLYRRDPTEKFSLPHGPIVLACRQEARKRKTIAYARSPGSGVARLRDLDLADI